VPGTCQSFGWGQDQRIDLREKSVWQSLLKVGNESESIKGETKARAMQLKNTVVGVLLTFKWFDPG
jgi:hypothetical protein